MPSIHSYVYSMEENTRYATLADEAMTNSDTLVLNGHNCGLRVRNKALHVTPGSLLGVEREPVIYYKGLVPIKTIVIVVKSGNITIEALHWCREQNVSIVMLDSVGNLAYSISPEGESNAKLRRLQYQAEDTGMAGYIARELVRRKTVAQIATLRTMSQHKYTRPFKKYRDSLLQDKHEWQFIKSKLVELDSAGDIDALC